MTEPLPGFIEARVTESQPSRLETTDGNGWTRARRGSSRSRHAGDETTQRAAPTKKPRNIGQAFATNQHERHDQDVLGLSTNSWYIYRPPFSAAIVPGASGG